MTPSLVAAILAVLLIIPIRSYAVEMSAQDLLATCSGDATTKAMCDGYLMAVTDLVLRRESRHRGKGRFCLPETVTIGQVRDAVLKAANRPAAHAPTGLDLVAAAMLTSWPCARTPGRPMGGRHGGADNDLLDDPAGPPSNQGSPSR